MSVNGTYESESLVNYVNIETLEFVQLFKELYSNNNFYTETNFENAQHFYNLFMNMIKENADEIFENIEYPLNIRFDQNLYLRRLINNWRSNLFMNPLIMNKSDFSPIDFSGSREIVYKLNDFTSSYSVADLTNKYWQNASPIKMEVSSIPLYPIAIKEKIGQNGYLIERSPFKLKLNFKSSKSHNREPKKRLDTYVWVPWSLYFFDSTTNRISVYFGSGPSSNPDTRYVNCTFPNTYSDGTICWNASLSKYDFSNIKDVREHFGMLINEYYSGGWNTDLFPTTLNFIKHDEDFSEPFNNFLKPTQEYFPNLTPGKFEAFKNRASNFGLTNSYAKKFKHFFEVMSHYDLEKTLLFYKDLASTMPEGDNYTNCHTYDQIISLSSSASTNATYFQNSINYAKKYHEKNTCNLSVDREKLPQIIVNYENITFYDFEKLFHSMIIRDLNLSSSTQDLREAFYDFNGISNSANPRFHVNHFVQDIIAKVINNNIINNAKLNDSVENINECLYFSYDFLTGKSFEYKSVEDYEEYLSNYNLSKNRKEINAAI